ncbi:MAG: flagellar M-ring protein FliF [Alphaproteobacteria bacterium]|nr:flagellar M-ring protein FliF [Alphaproteobacteria bacterium]
MQGFAQTLRNLGTVRLVAMGGVAIGIVAFFIFLSARLNSTDMSLLYGDLDSGDSAKIVSKLESMGVPFELTGEGRRIMVPSDQALKLRMAMAQEGLPNGGSVGYELFDRSESLGSTNFVQNVNLLRALEGELSRTIRSLSQVQEARVHLVMPKRELFSRKQQEPSASVVVKTRGPQKLGKTQVLAIQQLVAAAVPGLKVSRISVIDHRGRLLARAGNADEQGAYAASDHDELQRVQENHLVRVIEELVEQSVGIGRVRAQVTAAMDFDRITTNAEIYDPEGQVVRSTQNVEEQANSADSSGSKTVSVANNLPDAPDSKNGADGNSQSRSSRTEETVNFEISKTVRSHVRESGKVRRLSIAVLIDGTYATDKDGKRVYTPRSKEELDKLDKLVRSAVGYDEKRGDTLELINMPFVNALERELDTVEPLFGLTKSDYFRIAEIFVLAAVGILVILLVVRPLVARTLEALPSVLAGGGEHNLLANQSADMPALTGPSDTGVGGQRIEEEVDDLIDVASIDGKVRASTIKKIEEIVERHPEETVGILRQWMTQDAA